MRHRDLRVWAIVRDVLLQVPVNVVWGCLPRVICDYNRPEEQAYEYAALAPFWRAYHQAIHERLTAARAAGWSPLFLDYHGFSRPPAGWDFDVILGTGNRTTARSDVDQRLGTCLRKAGYKVFVPEGEPMVPGVRDYLNGGYTIRKVAEDLKVDAVQAEIAKRFRGADSVDEGWRLAGGLAEFVAALAERQRLAHRWF